MTRPMRRFRFRLLGFLLFSVLAGLALGLLLRPFLQPKASTAASSVRIEEAVTPDASAAEVFVNLDFVSDLRGKRLVHAVVRHRPLPTWAGVHRAPPIDFSVEPVHRHAPLSVGISVRGAEVYIDGQRWIPEGRPSILVFNPTSRTFHEIAITEQDVEVSSARDVTRLREWNAAVVPAMREIYSELEQES